MIGKFIWSVWMDMQKGIVNINNKKAGIAAKSQIWPVWTLAKSIKSRWKFLLHSSQLPGSQFR